MGGKPRTPNGEIRSPRLADRLAEARRRGFVGRTAELRLFGEALSATEPPFAILHLHGLGGIGKTTLLQAFAQRAAEAGRRVFAVDGRDLEPSASALLRALAEQQRRAPRNETHPEEALPPNSVLLIDTLERLAPLDAWLRTTLLPALPAGVLVVLAGRNPPASAWRSDLDWAALTHVITLTPWSLDESRAFLRLHGVAEARHDGLHTLSRGHPLALALLATDDSGLGSGELASRPALVAALVERFVQGVPSPEHRRALALCALAWTTTADLLAEIVSEERAPELFAWLSDLPFVEAGPRGLRPHDLVRDVLAAELRWRSPESHHSITTAIGQHLQRRSGDGSDLSLQRTRLELLYLRRHDPFQGPYFDWSSLETSRAEAATRADRDGIVAMVRRHEGEESARIAHYWFGRQPEAFRVFRDADGPFGFMAHLRLDGDAGDAEIDPAVRAVVAYAAAQGAARPGETTLLLRFWMHRERYQKVSPALTLTAISCVQRWLTQPNLAWNFLAMSDPDFMEPHFTSIHMWRTPEADFVVAGLRYGLFGHDWRLEPPALWQHLAPHHGIPPDAAAPAPAPFRYAVLTRGEFDAAVHQGFRDLRRPERLATCPLLRTRLFPRREDATARALADLLRAAADDLGNLPRGDKFRRALDATYLDPAASQELAAERLGIPFNTYRYRLKRAVQLVGEELWRRVVGPPLG